MALVLKDRVKETTTTTSTGTYTLAGAVVGYQSFAVIGNANTTYYAVTNGTDWEVGIGTYTASGTTLSRDTILESSNAGNAVNWSAGVKDIFVTYPAERSMYVDGTTITPATAASLAVASGGTGQTSYTDGQLLIGNTTGNTLAKGTLTAGTGISITNGAGSITVAATNNGTVTSVGGTGTVNGITLTGTVTSSGNLTLGGTLSGVNLTTQVTGTLPIANGGSGQTTAQAAMNAFAGAVTSGSYLRGNGSNVVMSTIQAGDVPTLNQNTTGSAATLTTARTIQTNLASTSAASFNGSANITPGVTGTLPVANGGTGVTSSTGTTAVVLSTTPVIIGLREKSAAIAASAIDLSLGNYFTKTISGTTTFTVSNVATSGDVAAFVLVLTNGGSATVNWFSGVTWNEATAPTLTAAGIDILAFFTINGGTTWRGLVLAQAVA